jgi:hypothetical protein
MTGIPPASLCGRAVIRPFHILILAGQLAHR